MPTSYTSLLGLALPVTGELSGTWGDTVNDYITQYLDAAVAGAQTISGSQTAVTLSKTTASSLTQAGSGATGSSQYQIINCTGNPASLLTITAPAASKVYLVLNSTSTSQSVKVVGAGPTTGVTMVSGEKALIAWDGSDFVKVASSTADGVTTFSAGTTGFTPSTATSGAVTLAGTLATTNGGTGLTSFTANGVVYASSTSALATGSALTFDGTSLGIGGVGTSDGRAVFYEATAGSGAAFYSSGGNSAGVIGTTNEASTSNGLLINAFRSGGKIAFNVAGSEQMRLTSTGLGIGTSSPTSKLTVAGAISVNTGAANLNALYLLSGNSGNRIGLSMGRTAQEAYIGIASTSNSIINGDVAGDLDILTTTGNIRFSTNAGASLQATLDTSGNLGLGVTPSAWNSSQWSVFEGAYGGALAFYKASNVPVTVLTSNAYNDGSWKYKTTDPALQYEMDGNVGIHKWYTAASGTAGNAISFTQAMTLDASSQLLVGTTSNPYGNRFTVGGSATYRGVEISTTTASARPTLTFLNINTNTYGSFIQDSSAGDLIFGRVNADYGGHTERARITSGGNLSLGGSADRGTTVGTNALQIFNGTAPAGTLTNGVSLYSSSGDLFFMDAAGTASKVGYRGVPQSGSAKTTSYTLATTDVGEYIEVGSGGSITIPDATFATGDVVSIFNNTTGNITITCSITTAYIAGTDSDKATMTLATRGVATVLFISSTVCVVTGNVT